MEQARRDTKHIDDHHRRLAVVRVDRNISPAVAVGQQIEPSVGDRIGSAVVNRRKQLMEVDDILARCEVADHVERRAQEVEHEGVAAGSAVEGVRAVSGHDRVVAAAGLDRVTEIIGNDGVVAVAGPGVLDDGAGCDLQALSGNGVDRAGIQDRDTIRW